jgi:hypothetical protein
MLLWLSGLRGGIYLQSQFTQEAGSSMATDAGNPPPALIP